MSKDKKTPNTELDLTYRDGSNYKTTCRIVLAGQIQWSHVQVMKRHLNEEQFCIPRQIGLPVPAEDFQNRHTFPTDDDHPWTDLELPNCPADVPHFWTDKEPTVSMSVDELTKTIAATTWDEIAEMKILGLPGAEGVAA